MHGYKWPINCTRTRAVLLATAGYASALGKSMAVGILSGFHPRYYDAAGDDAAAAAAAHDGHLISQLDSAHYNFSGHGSNDSIDDYYDYGCVYR